MTPDDISALKRAAEAPLEAGGEDLAKVAADLAAAFTSDPIFNWFLRDDAGREPARQRVFRNLTGAGMAGGTVSRPATGGAAAIWMPSESLDGPEPGFLQQMRRLPSVLATTGVSRFRRLAALRAMMQANHPREPHAYLWFIGVRPEAQGLGIGSRLLAHGLAQVDAKGLPAYLESSAEANVPLYRRYGFEVIQVLRAAPGAPPMWAMWRPAQPSA